MLQQYVAANLGPDAPRHCQFQQTLMLEKTFLYHSYECKTMSHSDDDMHLNVCKDRLLVVHHRRQHHLRGRRVTEQQPRVPGQLLRPHRQDAHVCTEGQLPPPRPAPRWKHACRHGQTLSTW